MSKIIVRTSIGFTIPDDAILIGSGKMSITHGFEVNEEFFYDYLINPEDFNKFLEDNASDLHRVNIQNLKKI